MLEIDEEGMQYYRPELIVPCRGREGLADSFSHSAFTEDELDAIAPLAPRDPREMGEDRTPSPDTIERIEERIKSAHLLKYGRAE